MSSYLRACDTATCGMSRPALTSLGNASGGCARTNYGSSQRALLVVPTSKDAFDIMYTHADWQADFDREGEPEHAYPEPEWMAVSLDFFG
jgi:hypothetical protein